MRLGVDFGTTTTAIAIVDRGNYPIVSFVNNNDDTVDFVPSIIALDAITWFTASTQKTRPTRALLTCVLSSACSPTRR